MISPALLLEDSVLKAAEKVGLPAEDVRIIVERAEVMAHLLDLYEEGGNPRQIANVVGLRVEAERAQAHPTPRD